MAMAQLPTVSTVKCVHCLKDLPHPERASTPGTPFPLMNFAPELHLIVAKNLDPFDRISLKRTNRYFYSTISAFQSNELSHVQNQLYKRRGPAKQAIPGTTVKNDKDPFLACMCCCRLRPMLKFADEQQRCFPRLKVPSYLTRDLSFPFDNRMRRLCISCGIFNGIAGHLPGNITKLDEKDIVVCHFCKQYGWIGAREKKRRAAGLCDKCWKVLEANRGSGTILSYDQEEL